MWDAIQSVLGIGALYLFLLGGLVAIIFGLPGTFVILGAAAVYGWATGFAHITGGTLGWLTAMTVAAEALEQIAGVYGSKKFGSSRKALIGSIVGGIVGAIMFAPFLLGVGAVLGAFFGAFAGAFLTEMIFERKEMREALRSGYGAFFGRVGGFIFKMSLAVAMVVLVSFRLW
ncbi:MAG: DUF456 domain-containing protein [Phycisphaerales bacterium]|nr:DUF456 domain-containing protein [Phycisphaerales bacterium]MCA9771422.1 DUF456 domain-containing protein [Myxococcales bacterium]